VYNRYAKRRDVYYYLVVALLVLSSACSIFSQLLIFPPNVRELLNYAPWVVTIVYMVIYLNYTNLTHFSLLLILIVPFGMVALGIIFGMSYDPALVRCLIVCALIYGIGVLLGEYLEPEYFNFILKGIVIATLLVALYTFFFIFGGNFFAAGVGVDNKNALGLIFAVPIVIMLFNNSIFEKLKFVFIPFLVVLVILCASRMSMVCCLLAIVARIFIGNRNNKEKVFYTVVILSIIVFVFSNEKLYFRIVTEIFLKGHEEITEEDVYHITSGRSGAIKSFRYVLKDTWFIGGGGYAFENFYLDTINKFGIVGGIPIFIFVCAPTYYCIKDRKNESTRELRNLLLTLNVLMLINGLGEELTPLGPGVKCFVLWLTFGYYMGMRNKQRELALYEDDDEDLPYEEEYSEV